MLLGDRESINKLFSHGVQYKVPHYQRRYVWDQTNWSTLSEDILAHLGQELEDITDGGYTFKPLKQRVDTSTGEYKKHFTGIIVIHQISQGEPEIFEVIDGQQRLTTFQIILCVIRDIFESKGYSKQAEEPQRLIMNEIANVESLKFIPADYDQWTFQKIVEGTYGKLISQLFDKNPNRVTLDDKSLGHIRQQLCFGGDSDNVSQNILDVYNYFYEWIRLYVQQTEDDPKLSTLLSVIKVQFDFVRLTLDESDHSEEIFESLNATGRKLSDFDYLRNNLFLRARQLDHPESEESNSDRFYKEYWNFEKDKEAWHYWHTDRQEEFLRAFLIAHLGPYCFKTENVKPFDVYRKYRMTVAKGIEDEFKQLNAYAESYRELDNNMDDPDKPIYRYIQLCSHLSLPRMDPLMLYVRHNCGDSVVNRVCEILESYLVRRILYFGDKQDTYADVNDASYTRIRYFFSKAVREGKFDVNELTQFLSDSEKLSFESEAAIWPNDTQVQKVLKCVGTKDFGFISYVFQQLEHCSSKEENASWEFSSLTLDEQSDCLKQLQSGGISISESQFSIYLANFNNLWEPPPKKIGKAF